jgi:environmental stress-induced protein Ves
MTGARVLRAEDHERMPWANGGGTTYQVATGPEGAGLDSFDWRVSLADIDAGGPFSSFPGIDRILMVLDGPGIELVVDGRLVPLGQLDPLRFDGEADTSCSLLGGPTRDLNLMTRRGRCTGTVDVLAVGDGTQVEAVEGGSVLVVVVSGEVVADGLTLGPRDVLVVSEAVVLHGSGATALVTVRPAGPA